MKKSQHENYTPPDDFEDLTLFADESFDTQDVDLFEFASEESSPLTRLKSIILSLDWEINDEILQELADEILTLEPMWQGDKVAEVYLQGLAKIGNYIRTKGAYAHPNSIKLLLTFFYNFEKIISSPDMTGEIITQLLKGDVRKFKILQYQITQSEKNEPEIEAKSIAPSIEDSPLPLTPIEDTSPNQLLKASILGLDWEVTDESLLQFKQNLDLCHQRLIDNKPALVLIQGLQVLGDYIAEERAQAHPYSFTLLHFFNEALEEISTENNLADSAIQDKLEDCVNRLNDLKMQIAEKNTHQEDNKEFSAIAEVEPSSPLLTEQDITELTLDEDPIDVSPEATEQDEKPNFDDNLSFIDEIDSIFGIESKPAMETADEQYPDEILPPDAIHPVDDVLADDLIGAQLSSKRGLAPALSDSDEESGFSDTAAGETDSVDNDLALQLDFLFADDESTKTEENGAEEPALASIADDIDIESSPIAALADVEFSFEDEAKEKSEQETVGEELSFDIEDKLDSFFLDSEEEITQQEPTITKEEEANENAGMPDNQTGPIAALADSDEEAGFSEEMTVASLNNSPLDEIEEKLDLFFGDEPEKLDEDTPDIEPALSDAQSEHEETTSPAPLRASKPVEENSELSGALDAFFQTTEPAVATESAEKGTPDDLTEALEATLDEDSPREAIADFSAEVALLGAFLPAAVRALERDKLSETETILAKLQKSCPSAEHKAITELLHSVVALLSRLPAKSAKDTEKLVNYLYEQLMAKELAATVLPSAITRFNCWMLDAAKFMPRVPACAEKDTETEEVQYTAKELYFELAELKQYINDEFAKVRHHLEHHH